MFLALTPTRYQEDADAPRTNDGVILVNTDDVRLFLPFTPDQRGAAQITRIVFRDDRPTIFVKEVVASIGKVMAVPVFPENSWDAYKPS